MNTIRVGIVDDHPIVADGITLHLQTALRVTVVANERTFGAFQTTVATVPIDVCVLDLHGVQSSPLAMVRWMRLHSPKTKIIIFSSALDVAPELLEAGVHGYVLKEDMVSLLLDAISAVYEGSQFLSPAVREYIQQIDSSERLSLLPREVSVLSLLSQGNSTQQIADAMGIDARTVQNYITGLLKKTRCDSRTVLALWYRQYHEPVS